MKKLIGPRLIRRLGGIPGALARRELHLPDLAKPDGYKLMLVLFEKNDYKKDALDTRLIENRRYEAIARRPDAVKDGVGIDPDKRAYHMFIKSGLTDDQINHIYGFVYDSEAEGPGTALDPRKIQEAVLRFYQTLGRGSTPRFPSIHKPVLKTSDGHAAATHRHQTSYHPRSRAGTKGSYAREPWEEETFPTEDGYEYNDWDESTWQQYPAEEYDDWEEDADLETFLGPWCS